VEIEKVKSEFSLQIEWRPFMLRPNAPEEGWELPPHIKQQIKSPNNPLQARAKSLGIEMKQRERIPSTRRAHEATEYARSKGKIDDFHHTLLRRYWSEGEDLHDWATLRAAALDAGLDADEMQSEVSAGKWKSAVDTFLQEAAMSQVNSVPMFVVNGRYGIPGAQNAETFRQVFRKMSAKA
jgi:predicted DsbA family dithiol-disulfide isomerase